VSSYRISQLAERSGVPATTLRFYETAGLLSAQRTASGYRIYDDAAVDRLAFISAAKLLGLPLEQIRDLLGVWEQGVCAHVRARLLPLVVGGIGDADHRMAELSAFSARLARVHEDLLGPAPEGACGPGCGCVPAPTGPVLVELSSQADLGSSCLPREDVGGQAGQQAAVVCTLSGSEQTERVDEWQRLLASATGRSGIASGVRLEFPSDPDLVAAVAGLAAAEQKCCAFFDFTLHLTAETLVVTVRAPEAASALVAELFGASA